MNVSKETVTPKKAMEWLKRNVHNRPLSQHLVAHYGRAMSSNEWKLNGDTIRFNGNGDLIDGQHRLTACVQTGKAFESYIVRGLDHDAFDTIDQGRTRTVGDVFARRDFKNYNALAAAVRCMWLYFVPNDSGRTTKRGAMRASEANAIIDAHPELHTYVDRAHRIYMASRLIPAGLLAFLMYATSRKNESLANDFWTQAIESVGLQKGTPAFLLNKRLIANVSSVAKIDKVTMAALCIKAWNAHRTNKPCGSLKWGAEEAFPTIIL